MNRTIRRTFLAFALAFTAPLAACDTVSHWFGSAAGTTTQQVDVVMNMAKKGMTAAHDAHGFAADLSVGFVHTGALHGTSAARVSNLLTQSAAVLKVGDRAISLGDAQGALDAIDKANALVAEIRTLFPH